MTATMTGLVNFAAERGAVELREVPVPAIGAHDALLAVRAAAVCGSDLHQWHGSQSWAVNHPVVLGHEFCGEIAELGPEVRGFALGDRVVSETAAVIDEQGPYARTGAYHLDPGRRGFGYGVDGAMARFVRVPARCLHRIPDGLPFEIAALTEPCCVAYHAVCINGLVRPGDSVAVIGPGAIGLLCAAMAAVAGAHPLAVVGTAADAPRLAIAPRLGATHLAGGDGADPRSALRALGDGAGVDVVIDAAGVSDTLRLALDAVRPGGRIVKVGWGPQPCGFSLDPLIAKGVTLVGSFSHTWAMWEKVLALLGCGRLDPRPILGRVAPLADWRACFDAMRRGELVKAVLVP